MFSAAHRLALLPLRALAAALLFNAACALLVLAARCEGAESAQGQLLAATARCLGRL